MGPLARIAVIGLLTLASGAAAVEMPLAVFPINAESMAQMCQYHPLTSAEVNDPVYKRQQRYQGFWLRDILKDLGQQGHPESDAYVRFCCQDGYLPLIPLFLQLHLFDGNVQVVDSKAMGIPAAGRSWSASH